MRALLFASVCCASLVSAASAPVAAPGPSLETQLRAAQADQTRSEVEAKRLGEAAERARGTAAKLAAERAAAAQAIDAAEARITAEDVAFRLQSARLLAFQRRLAAEQRPISALLTGLVTMGQRPPILALADRGGVEELVRMRILLNSTMPVIRRRSDRLAARIEQGRKLRLAAADARAGLVAGRQMLVQRQERFAGLEAKASEAALAAGSAALNAGDVAIAGQETIERLQGENARQGTRSALASDLASQVIIPIAGARPSPLAAPFPYRLPADAPVVRGLGDVDRSGVRSRGVDLAVRRGVPLVVPASGTIRFAGPFRDHDGVVIIDHGGGWLSLILGVASPLKPGATVAIGDPLGRSLGPVAVELSHNGQYHSPAIIAGSSRNLSKNGKSG